MAKGTKEDIAFQKAVGNRIKHFRKKKDMTQKELGYAIEMEESHVNRLERGNTNVTIRKLRKVCNALDITLSTLFEGVE